MNDIRSVSLLEAVRNSGIPEQEIIIVDDCSTDGTQDILRAEICFLVDRVIFHDINRGKGDGKRTGFQEATGDVVIVQDADLNMTRGSIPACLSLYLIVERT